MTLGWWLLVILGGIAVAAGVEAWVKRGRRRPLAETIARSVSARAGYETDQSAARPGAARKVPWLTPMTGRTADALIARPHPSWTDGPDTDRQTSNQTSEDKT